MVFVIDLSIYTSSAIIADVAFVIFCFLFLSLATFVLYSFSIDVLCSLFV